MPPKTESSTDPIKVFNLFWETSHVFINATDRYLKKSLGLSAGKFVVLMVLFYSGGTMTSAKLAARTGTRPHNITALIRRLKQQGFVTTARGTEDNRFVFITLTPKGSKLMEGAMPDMREFVHRTMSSIKKTELAALFGTLNKIEKNMKKK